MIAFLFLGLKEDLDADLSVETVCLIKRNFLPYSSNSSLNFALSILLADGTNFRLLSCREFSERDKCLLDKLMRLLLTNLPCNL